MRADRLKETPERAGRGREVTEYRVLIVAPGEECVLQLASAMRAVGLPSTIADSAAVAWDALQYKTFSAVLVSDAVDHSLLSELRLREPSPLRVMLTMTTDDWTRTARATGTVELLFPREYTPAELEVFAKWVQAGVRKRELERRSG